MKSKPVKMCCMKVFQASFWPHEAVAAVLLHSNNHTIHPNQWSPSQWKRPAWKLFLSGLILTTYSHSSSASTFKRSYRCSNKHELWGVIIISAWHIDSRKQICWYPQDVHDWRMEWQQLLAQYKELLSLLSHHHYHYDRWVLGLVLR